MRTHRLLVGFLLISMATLLIPAPAAGGPELTFSLGGMVGDSFADVLQVRPSSLTEGFDTAPIFGGRLGWSAFPFAIEGSLMYSPSAISVANAGSLDANLVYAEAELQILILPGPITPFVAAGIGLHSMQLTAGNVPRETMVGYVFGGGLKAGFGKLGVRLDLKDHITPLDVAELGPEFLQVVGIAENTNLHNIEFTGGITIRF